MTVGRHQSAVASRQSAVAWAQCPRFKKVQIFRAALIIAVVLLQPLASRLQPPLFAQPPASSLQTLELTQPVNDFAHVIDSANAQEIDALIRALKAASGDVVVVATVPTIEPFADINEYKVKLFENHGRGIGEKGKDNGLLIVVAIKERRVGIEVGYELEQWITDGLAGQTIRELMAPAFREGRYGDGLRAGTARIVGRIAEGRQVTLQGVRVPREQPEPDAPFSLLVPVLLFIAILVISRLGGGPGAPTRMWGGRGWSGWSSGVGPFGGGWNGRSSGGGGFGGGFGGFGGGGSGGGGASGGW